MRLLVSCNRRRLASRMDLNALRQFEALQAHADVFWHGAGWETDEGETIAEAARRFQPDLVYCADFRCVDLREVDRVRVPKAILYEDPWDDVEERIETFLRGRFDIFVTKYRVALEPYRERCPRAAFILHPHGYNPSVFGISAARKERDILLCGRDDDEQYYSVRRRLKRIGRALRDRGYDVLDHPHSGYWEIGEPKHDDGQATLAMLGASSRVSIVGTAFGAHVAKLWELPATGSLCFTDLNPSEPDCDRLATHVWRCEPDRTDAEIADDLERAVEAAERLGPTYAERVAAYATMDHRAAALVRSFEAYLAGTASGGSA